MSDSGLEETKSDNGIEEENDSNVTSDYDYDANVTTPFLNKNSN